MSFTGPVKPKWVVWRSEPDSCKECRARDGKVYDENMLEALGQTPPLHPNCKCELRAHGGEGRSDSYVSNDYYEPEVSTVPYYEEPERYDSEADDYYEEEPEASTVPYGGVYAQERDEFRKDAFPPQDDRKEFTEGTPFVAKKAFEEAIRATNSEYISNAVSLLGASFPFKSMVNIAFKALLGNGAISRIISIADYSNENYKNNKELSFYGYINDQKSGEAAKVAMGIQNDSVKVALGDSNACGWVAAYNASVKLGIYIPPADIVRFFELDNGLVAHGIFGVNPLAFDRLFKACGFESTTTLFRDACEITFNEKSYPQLYNLTKNILPTATDLNLDEMARKGRTVIIAVLNDKNDITLGAHYVNATWYEKEGIYVAWNTGLEKDKAQEFASIYDFVGENEELISMTVIK